MPLPEDLIRMEQSLRDLTIKYEQYFVGIEKREPLQLLDELERLARQYQNVSITNTMLKFRYQSLVASLSTQKQKWGRISRLIEEGKFQRDRFRMARHDEERGKAPVRRPSGGETEVERVYQAYLAARKSCNLPVESVTREKIAEAIAKQRPTIAKKYNCSDMEFTVVVEEGKPRIKAHPKSS